MRPLGAPSMSSPLEKYSRVGPVAQMVEMTHKTPVEKPTVSEKPKLRSTMLDVLNIASHKTVGGYLAENGDEVVHFSLLVNEVDSGKVHTVKVLVITNQAIYLIPRSSASSGIFFNCRHPLVNVTQVLVHEDENKVTRVIQINGLKMVSGESALFTLELPDEQKERECLLTMCHLRPKMPVLRKKKIDGRYYDMKYVDTQLTKTRNPPTAMEVTSPLNTNPPLTPLEERRAMQGKTSRRPKLVDFTTHAVRQDASILPQAAGTPPRSVARILLDDASEETDSDIDSEAYYHAPQQVLPHHGYRPGETDMAQPRYDDGSVRLFGGEMKRRVARQTKRSTEQKKVVLPVDMSGERKEVVQMLAERQARMDVSMGEAVVDEREKASRVIERQEDGKSNMAALKEKIKQLKEKHALKEASLVTTHTMEAAKFERLVGESRGEAAAAAPREHRPTTPRAPLPPTTPKPRPNTFFTPPEKPPLTPTPSPPGIHIPTDEELLEHERLAGMLDD